MVTAQILSRGEHETKKETMNLTSATQNNQPQPTTIAKKQQPNDTHSSQQEKFRRLTHIQKNVITSHWGNADENHSHWVRMATSPNYSNK